MGTMPDSRNRAAPSPSVNGNGLHGHALRNAHLCEHSLHRAEGAPPLARAVVRIRAGTLRITRLEAARRAGISRAAMRDMELGIHTPTRHTLQQFMTFCEGQGVTGEQLEELRLLYTGQADTLERFIARLELKAGSSRELARRVGISPATLWEYRRGNFPLPIGVLRQLCAVVAEDSARGEALWHQAERRRLLDRGYPEALADLCVLCARAGHPESYFLSTASLRRLRYFELPRWSSVADAARGLCRSDDEFLSLQKTWLRNEAEQRGRARNDFGLRLKQLRQEQGVSRRELADLFGVGGKKPARIIKYVEEDGFYSMQAYPAGLAAVLAGRSPEAARLLEQWQQRRQIFHRRHRPEMRIDLRLARETYGFELKDVAPLLGYGAREYQKVEGGVEPLRETARERILQAIHAAGQKRVEDLLAHRRALQAAELAWRAPRSVAELITLLARREGGLAPLVRLLRRTPGLDGLSTVRLRGIVRGAETPPWCLLFAIGAACGVEDLTIAHHDWAERYRAALASWCPSPLGVELRVLIAEVAPSLRAFSPRLGFNYSVLTREFQRIDRDEPIKWFHVERVLRAAGLPPDSDRWREVRALWSTAEARRKRPTNTFNA
jgi:transcriptional regulator with XRE-family HTH domain